MVCKKKKFLSLQEVAGEREREILNFFIDHDCMNRNVRMRKAVNPTITSKTAGEIIIHQEQLHSVCTLYILSM